jgi:hypothetical protein
MKRIPGLLVTAVVPWLVACESPPAADTRTSAPTATAASTAPAKSAAVAVPPTASAAPPASASAAAPDAAPLALPAALTGKAVLVPKGDPDEARADLASAQKAAGEGGLTQGLVVRLTADIPVWRMWSGAKKKDATGRTNRVGQWWSYDAPHGTQQEYRTDYEICVAWNDLTWVAKCTLKKGAVVAVGPGQSVSAKACGDPAGKESYPADTRDWQVWVSKVWARPQELDCPAETADYEADPADISHPKKGAAKPAVAK